MSSNRSVTPDHDALETLYAGLERLERPTGATTAWSTSATWSKAKTAKR